ncbi:selenocysteinyl-tRNA-specific translation factor [Escherichia coli]|uniref:Selenocysteinyl-tRNA-specific translation factor n=1 Tax=Escherichia coli TaxID=562 RepID=A0A377AKW5_ECOLX|nr:selenocysteinyl-tRNA-specific translation factor [Escherichia coli]
MALPMEDEALVLLLIEKMRESGDILSHHGWLHLPDHKAGFSEEQQAIWQKAEPLFGDEPWWVRDLAKETGTDEQANAPDATPGGAARNNYRDRQRSLLP